MKIFFYKSILIFVLFILAIHFSFGLIKKELSREISNLTSKESLEAMKDKLREEIKIGSEKDNILKPEDAKIIKRFLDKVQSELINSTEK